MKKHFLFFFVLIFCGSSGVDLSAQSAFGTYLGLHSMKFTGDSPTAGFFSLEGGNKFGLTYDYRFNQVVSIHSRIDYNYNQLKYVFADTTAEEEKDSMQIKIKAVSIPVSAVVWSENGRYYVFTGIEFYMPVYFKGHQPDKVIDYKNEIRTIILNAHFGVGMIIPVGKPFLFIEARYTQGLVDMNIPAVHNAAVSNYPRTKAFATSLIFGIKLPIGKTNYFNVHKEKNNE